MSDRRRRHLRPRPAVPASPGSASGWATGWATAWATAWAQVSDV